MYFTLASTLDKTVPKNDIKIDRKK